MQSIVLIFLPVKKENINLKNELIARVHHFYPVGADSFTFGYKGKEDLLRIIENKIDKEANNPGAEFNVFCEKIQSILPESEVENRIDCQFPN